MSKHFRPAGVLFAIAFFCVVRSARGANPTDTPDGWQPSSPRAEIAPRSWVERDANNGYALGLAGRGEASVDGRWQRRVPVLPGGYYVFHADYAAERVATPARSVLARVVWLDDKGRPVGQPEYPLTASPPPGDGGRVLTGTYQAPPKAAAAQLELHLRWAAEGRVLFRNVGLKETAAPTPRKVRLATVNHRPRNSPGSRANLDAFGKLVDEAAGRKADIVCLPEGITVVGTKQTYAEAAEAIPGPSTEFLGRVAAKHGVYVVAGIYERDGHAVYNTAVLLGRDGKLVGKYRKVCLPREEIDGGITPGTDYPVFDTDFGRVGMMICWDVHFPEVARELSARGAEVILMPIWGGNETLAKARAIENQIHLVASGYDFVSAVYDKAGEPVVKAAGDPAVLVTEVDLNDRLLWPWLGDWRARIWREGPARAEP